MKSIILSKYNITSKLHMIVFYKIYIRKIDKRINSKNFPKLGKVYFVFLEATEFPTLKKQGYICIYRYINTVHKGNKYKREGKNNSMSTTLIIIYKEI